MCRGFTFCIWGKDYFVPTKLVKRTKKAAERIISQLAVPATETNISYIFNHMEMCDMEKRNYGYHISGDNYGNHFTLCIPYSDMESFVIMKEV